MDLLERQKFLDELDRRYARVAGGVGQAVFVAGEAGVGKSALTAAFLAQDGREGAALRGYCDALSTPLALGPILEVTAQLGVEFDVEPSAFASRGELFASLLSALQQASRPSVIVLEDLHWADEATLDFVRYVGRRIRRAPYLMIGTYRDDEVGAAHPLRRTLGDLIGDDIVRLRLPPLSEAAVATMAAAEHRSPQRVFAITGGNPFFVREVLSSPAGLVPETVRDSIMARLARCTPAARRISELVALSPGRMEMDAIHELLEDSQSAIDECIERGVLIHDRSGLSYRHELARRSVEDTLPPARSRELHARILSSLERRKADVARLVHHARGAHDGVAVLKHAPIAGKGAAAVGAHREAAAHYAAALEYVDTLSSSEQAQLYELHAYECYLTSLIADAIRSANAALRLQREIGDRTAQGRLLRFISRQYWFQGDRSNLERYAQEAIELLESGPHDRELAMAYSNRSQLSMLAGRVTDAVEYGERAVALARELGDVEIEAHALNNIGTARISAADEAGRAALEESLALALRHDLHEHVARAYVNLATSATAQQQVERARRYLADGVAYCEGRDLDSWTTYLHVYQARFDLDRGRWSEAATRAQALLNDSSTAITRIPALIVLAEVRARRSDPGCAQLLDEAMSLAAPTGELQRTGRVAAARAEAAWYRGDTDAVVREADVGLALAQGHADSWIKGELQFWRSRAAPAQALDDDLAEPYRLAVQGDWRAAAEKFAQHEMPYERALVLMNGDREAMAEAQSILTQLGASAALALLEKQLAASSSRSSARAAPTAQHGLTSRELQVLRLLGRGFTNAEVAKRLYLSAKTVDHHVSSILGKLQVRSRAHAVTAAFRLGLLDRGGDDPGAQ